MLFPFAIIITIPSRVEKARATMAAMISLGYPADKVSIFFGCDEARVDPAYTAIPRVLFNGRVQDRQRGNLGAALSHIYALRAAAWAGFDGVLMVEDDTCFEPGFIKEVNACWPDKENLRWLGWIRFADRDGNSRAWMAHEHRILDGQIFSGSHCYYVPRVHMFTLASLFEMLRYSTDDAIMLAHWHGHVPGIAIVPQVAYQPDRDNSKKPAYIATTGLTTPPTQP